MFDRATGRAERVMERSRYVIGIDLGTSNSALAFVDTLAESPRSEVLAVPQLESPGAEAAFPVLPSFLYLATPSEREQGALRCSIIDEPQPSAAAGRFALNQTAYQPGRVIASAKSWLCHGGIDREAPILPWGFDEVPAAERHSPVAVSASILEHLKHAWNAQMAAYAEEYRFERQEVTITVPASFDDTAQRLTLQAAKDAGCSDRVRLLEEPQAALYRWLEDHALSELLGERDSVVVLVCDVGGGTTDFSLFTVKRDGAGAEPAVERIAVSDHILLGGDNIDLTIAHRLEASLAAGSGTDAPLSVRQWAHLVFAARTLKERVLSGGGDDSELLRVSIPGEGTSLFAAVRSAEITSGELRMMILEGFFPETSPEEQPASSSTGLRELGLPYAADTAVTRHLAAFLRGRQVDAVLFNGGSLRPELLRERLAAILASWQDGRAPRLLENPEPELAVARGGARFGLAVRNLVRRIAGGYARSVYIEVQKEGEAPQLVCILPQGFEANRVVRLESQRFKLLVGRPVRFQLYHSTHRPDDAAGDMAAFDPREFHPLPPVQTVLSSELLSRKKPDALLEVTLEASVSEVGMLQVACVHSPEEGEAQRFELAFNLRRELDAERPATGRQPGSALLPPELSEAAAAIGAFYGKAKAAASDDSPKRLVRRLEESIGAKKEQWDTPLLRALWQPLSQGITRRGRSLAHETTWLYLAGYLLRPGYGADLDEWRIDQLWRCHELGLSHPKENSALVQWWIMWRRVAGGLDAARQQALYRKVAPRLESKGKDDPELFRLAGSLEHLSQDEKRALGAIILRHATGRKNTGIEHFIWALGRLGSRVPLYGSTHRVLPSEVIEKWFSKLEPLDWQRGDYPALAAAFSQIARITGERELDLEPRLRERIVKKMRTCGASAEQLRVVEELVPVELADRVRLFGEALPGGLHL